MINGGMIVPSTATNTPIKPANRKPTTIAALTAIAPGADCAIAVIFNISFSVIHLYSSTNFDFINVTIT